jgi:choline-glycine betaine transporter
MDFVDTLRELLDFPYGWLVIAIIGIIVLVIVCSAVSSGVRRLSRLAERTRVL